VTERSDYYRILHVRRDAPTEIIRSSYRTLMQSLKLHPDLGGDLDQAAVLNEAYAVLSDPAKRARYDSSLELPLPGGEDPFRAAPASSAACLFCRTPCESERLGDPEAVCAECGSPLGLARRFRHEHSMRRMLRRIPRDYPIRIYATWNGEPGQQARMENLSLNGMRFRSRQQFEPHQLLKIDSDLCLALGRVTYCKPATDSSYVTGIEFATVRFTSVRGTFVSDEA
jgi:curved DNA-binding protein CbpA